MQGRAAIRMVSRGIFGAAAMTWGGRVARNQLNNYNQHTWEWDSSRPLQALAKGFDVTLGKVIGKMAYGMTSTKGLSAEAAIAARQKAAYEATTFRSKSYYHTRDGRLTADGGPMNGRSLGAEMVSVTFDFAMASIGDATTRNIIQAIDPNMVKPWIVDDDGKPAQPGQKGHFAFGKWCNSVAHTSWRILSKNQGEDWAAALPYVYQMKFQRQFLANTRGKRFAGTKMVFDNNWNGGAYEVNNAGQVVGDYQLPAAIDLHARFVGYNWYTLMFREAYDAVDGALHKWKEDGYKINMPHVHNPVHASLRAAGGSARYVAKSFVKANLYMNPSMFFFWPMRVSQSKWRGGMIYNGVSPTTSAIGATHSFSDQVTATQQKYAEHGVHVPFDTMRDRMVYQKPGHGIHFNYQTTRSKPNNGDITGQMPNRLYFGDEHSIANPMAGMKSPYDKRVYDHYATDTKTDRFEKGFSQTLNPLGKVSYDLGTWATNGLFKLSPNNPLRKFASKRDGYHDRQAPGHETHSKAAGENFVRSFIDTSLSYTPYMYAKAEFGMRVDDRPGGGKLGQMDKAIYELFDHVSQFDIAATGHSLSKIWNLSTHFERAVNAREGEVIEKHDRVGDGTNVPRRRDAKPLTKINAESITRSHRSKENKNAAHDPVSLARVDDDSADRQWAESVAGRHLGAQFQPPSPNRQ